MSRVLGVEARFCTKLLPGIIIASGEYISQINNQSAIGHYYLCIRKPMYGEQRQKAKAML
jgi:hypothetical protein